MDSNGVSSPVSRLFKGGNKVWDGGDIGWASWFVLNAIKLSKSFMVGELGFGSPFSVLDFGEVVSLVGSWVRFSWLGSSNGDIVYLFTVCVICNGKRVMMWDMVGTSRNAGISCDLFTNFVLEESLKSRADVSKAVMRDCL